MFEGKNWNQKEIQTFSIQYRFWKNTSYEIIEKLKRTVHEYLWLYLSFIYNIALIKGNTFSEVDFIFNSSQCATL